MRNMSFNKKFKRLKEVLEDSKELLSIDDYENATVLIDNNESLLATVAPAECNSIADADNLV